MPVLRNVGRQLEVGDVVNRLGHTLSGVAVGVWSLPVAPIVGVAGSVVWVAATTGFALAPDLDHPASTAARMWGPVSQGPAKLIGSVFGHRGATHRVAAVAAVGVAVWAATTGRVAPIAADIARHFGHARPVQLGQVVGDGAYLLVVAVTVGLALAALRLPWVMNLTLAWLTAGLTHRLDLPLAWLPWAAALGVAAHLAGDAITKQGLPGPRGHRVGPRLITTGGTAESVVCIILAAAIAAYPIRGHLAALIEGAIA